MAPSTPTTGLSTDDPEWHTLLAARVELAQIVRSVVDVLQSSSLVMSELIRSGRYVGMLDHFDTLLTSWKKSHLEGRGTFSLAIQAVVDRAFSEKQEPSGLANVVISPTEYRFIEATVDGCLEIFNIIIRLAEARQLAFAPENLFVRVTMASVFLMKAMGLGVKKSKLNHSLNTLTQAISGLRMNKPDDLHFGHQYVKLLDVCMANLQASFLPPMGLQLAQEQMNDCQSEPMAGFSALDFASIGDMDNCFDLSWFDVITNPLLDPLEHTEIRGDDSLGHDFFGFW
ncbi:hypothetical protein LCI18_001637 [Fusarium solani-melongenae]|uniref:Uncharacterized protein n=1 Tax=Fusarium solani subsp. cucurbitae TaxID=2747967 RepID=A0ACD3YNY8_FUSSC|nr:hypothetical protein LCI18_001637 [Fusarium solani-melongenae]